MQLGYHRMSEPEPGEGGLLCGKKTALCYGVR